MTVDEINKINSAPYNTENHHHFCFSRGDLICFKEISRRQLHKANFGTFLLKKLGEQSALCENMREKEGWNTGDDCLQAPAQVYGSQPQ